MVYKKKVDQERDFVQELLDDGGKVKEYCAMYGEGRAARFLYWQFVTGNGHVRYWTDMSRDNLRKLGVADDYCPEVQ